MIDLHTKKDIAIANMYFLSVRIVIIIKPEDRNVGDVVH